MRPHTLILLLPIASIVSAIVGCDSSSSSPTRVGVATSASASAVADTPAALSQPAPPPDDADVSAAQKALKCATDAKSGSCGVLAKLGKCTPWNPIVPSGDGRWIGRGTAVEAGKARDTIVLLRSRRVPLSEVAPGQLGVKVGIAEIPKDDAAFAQADRAIRAFERADVPPRANAALEYLKSLTQWPEGYVMKTKSGQIDVLMSEGAFVCQGPKQELVLMQRAAKTSGDGLYAELWAATW
jgi:hypothetical protein